MTAVQRRIEASARGRATVSAGIVAILVGVTTSALPDSPLRRSLLGPVAPVLNAVGADQRWDLFAPDPRRTSIDLVAYVTLSDGSVSRWYPPRRDALTGAYSDYRWRKLAEAATVRGGDPVLARQLAAWLARTWASGDVEPVHVQVVSRLVPLAPLGRDAGRAPAFIERTLAALALPQRSGPR